MKLYRALGCFVFLCACGPAEEPPTPVPPGTPTSQAAPATSPAAPTAPPIEPGPPQGYAADLAAAPRWVRFSITPPRPRMDYASQIPNAYRELEDGLAPLGPDFVGVLLCRIEVTERKDWDSHGLFGRHVEPDILVAGGAGDVRLRVFGPEDAYSFVASFPNVRLDQGFVLSLFDHDVNTNDRIETLQLSPPTEPTPFVNVNGERSRARCGGIPETQAVQRAQASLNTLAPVLTELESQPTPETDATISLLDPARRYARDAAAWLGWAHPAVVSVVARLDAVAVRWAMADADATSVPSSTEVQLPRMSVRLLDHECSEGRCRARVHASYARSGVVIALVALSPEGEVLAEEVASDPVRSSVARNIISRPGEYTHTFEWAGDTPVFVALRQNHDEAIIRVQ